MFSAMNPRGSKTWFIGGAILALGIFVVVTSCDDVIVRDISQSKVLVTSPKDSLVTANRAVTFWWDPMDGAKSYQVQIVQPDFDAITTVISDTTTRATKLVRTLPAGNYHWRVRGLNTSYKSQYVTRYLQVK